GAGAATVADAERWHNSARSRGRSGISDPRRRLPARAVAIRLAIGRNLRVEMRWAGANAANIRRHAQELIALAPDVILAHGGSPVGPLLQLTRNVPIVFPIAAGPVASGFVESFAHPGGNVTSWKRFRRAFV